MLLYIQSIQGHAGCILSTVPRARLPRANCAPTVRDGDTVDRNPA